MTAEMVAIARRLRPHAVCLVPEKRTEVTTEGGLDAVGGGAALAEAVAALGEAGCRVSLFIDPEPRQLDAAGPRWRRWSSCIPAPTARPQARRAAGELDRLRRGRPPCGGDRASNAMPATA